MKKKIDIKTYLKNLEAIAKWFEDEREIDVEQGLKKAKEGTEIIRSLKSSLKEVENEWSEIKRNIEE